MSAASRPDGATDRLIDRLVRIDVPAPTIVSCYLRLDEAARRRGAWLVDLLNRIRALENSPEWGRLDDAGRTAVLADAERIVRRLARPGGLPAVAGVAAFACRAIGLLEVVPVPRVHRSRVAIDRRPLIQELMDASETLGHYLAVLLDRNRARFFHVTAADTRELTALVPPSLRRGRRYRGDRSDAPGWGEHRYQQRILTERNRHYAAVAREVGRVLHARPCRGVALLGPDAHTGPLLEFLAPRIRSLVIGTARLRPASATPAEVARAVWALEWQTERRDEARLIDGVRDAVPRGWAANGLVPTLRALGRGQVRELIVPEGFSVAGVRCADTGRLAAEPAECRGRADPVPHLVDHAIEDALRQGAQVVVIDDPDVADRVNGLAATFRFRVPEPRRR